LLLYFLDTIKQNRTMF